MTESDTQGIGIVGTGDIALARYLPEVEGLVESGDARLHAVCDVEEERVRQIADEYGARDYYTDYKELLDDEAVDVVVNITPQSFHGEINLATVRHGKHLLSEKPISIDLSVADDILAAAEENDVEVAVAPPSILHPVYRYLKRFLDNGGIGDVAYVHAQSSHEGAGLHRPHHNPSWFYMEEEGGALFDMGIYGIQRLVYLLGPVKRVTAFSGQKQSERYVGYFNDDDEFVEETVEATADDNTLLLLDWGNQTYGFIAATHNVKAHKGPKDQLFGDQGTVCVNTSSESGLSPSIYIETDEIRGWIDDALPLRTNADLAPEDVPLGYDKGGFDIERAPPWDRGDEGGLEHLVSCLQQGKQPVISGALARHCLEIMTEARTSAEQGETRTVESGLER